MKKPGVGARVAVTGLMTAFGIAGVAFGLSAPGASSTAAKTVPHVQKQAHKPTHTQGTQATTDAMVVDGQKATMLTLESAKPYQPVAAPKTYDDYHCTLLDPHITKNSYIVASQFDPESPEDHHAILFLVPPNYAALAEHANGNGKGWSCFGEAPIPGTSSFQFSDTPWLAAWGPGTPRNIEPSGTGVPIAAGSLVIMQIHYNLLVGNKPVQSKMQLWTLPQTIPLKPLSLALYAAPPDLPCPTGIHGPLCNRAASLAYTGKQFGESAVNFVNILEDICGRNPSDPPASDSTSCTYSIGRSGVIMRIAPHEHLLGTHMKVVLNPGTPEAQTLLDVAYNFHDQHADNMPKPITVTPQDKISVSCTYNPKLRQEIPYLRPLPPQYITWGDGSADEMCLAIVLMAPAP